MSPAGTVAPATGSERPANPVRGEIGLPLGDTILCLRPSFQALLAVEAEIGSLAKAIERAAEGDVRLADLSAMFWHCGGRGVGQERPAFEAALEAAGLAALLPVYRGLLARVFRGSGHG